MREFPDKAFDLAIVDPPYGIDSASDHRGNSRYGNAQAFSKSYGRKDWDRKQPTEEYWIELRRVSLNQIIWGANHFGNMEGSPCWIVWDKLTGDNDYADCELAWTSFPTAVRKFSFQWKGMLQGDQRNKEERIHPTQKPVALYKWLLHYYAHPGARILDTHLGSMSIAIACHYGGYDLTGSEIDADYFAAGIKRVRECTAQLTLI
jgi:site-specific DNA-methyltransferase (adenine-specific)